MNSGKYWITWTKAIWIIVLVLSFIVFFPAFVAFVVMWAAGRIKIAG